MKRAFLLAVRAFAATAVLAGESALATARAASAAAAPAAEAWNEPPAPEVSPRAPGDRLIHIGIEVKKDGVSLLPEGPYRIVDAKQHEHELPAGQRYRLEAFEYGLKLGPWVLQGEARLTPLRPDSAVLFEARRYRGALILRRNDDGTVTVVNELPIEQYLLGVLPHEMEPGWPLEALKAQAVVARTFAYTQLGKYKKDGFDLGADTRSQVFGGWSPPHASIKKAVEQTRGEVLGYKGRILDVYYHACCGGHTEHAGRVWGAANVLPPLWGVKDKYCYQSPLARWTAYFSFEQIAAALASQGTLGTLRRFEIGRRNAGGYVVNFQAKVGAESFAIKATEFRRMLGNTQLRSTRILRLRKLKKGVEFQGSGSGHGVGLCQWGARLQAEKGRSYERILSFYFPGSTLSVIDQ